MFSFFKPTLSKIILSIFLIAMYYVLLLAPTIGLPAQILLAAFGIIFLFFTLIVLNFTAQLAQFLIANSVPHDVAFTIVPIVYFILLAIYAYIAACILLPIITYYTPKRLQKKLNFKGIKKGSNIFNNK
jgi:hypothetical protein